MGPEQDGHQTPGVFSGELSVHPVVERVVHAEQPAQRTARVAGKGSGAEHELHVGYHGPVDGVPGVGERDRLRPARDGVRAFAVDGVLQQVPGVAEPALDNGHRLVDQEHQACHGHVVLQVVAHFQVTDDGHADLGQVVGRPDAGQHEQLRRV